MPTKATLSPNPAAKKLRKWRTGRDMSQVALGRLVKVSQCTVSHWETERMRPEEPMRLWLQKVTAGAVKAGDWLTYKERRLWDRRLKGLGAQSVSP